MTDAVAREALTHWSIDVTSIQLIAQRENKVFRVTTTDSTDYALRVHRQGYQSGAAINSELLWMGHLASRNISVPAPLPAKHGKLVVHCSNHHCDLLNWLNGRPLGDNEALLALPDRQQTFHQIGRLMAHLHIESDAWQLPNSFERPVWDTDGLLGENPLWGRFWENPGLTSTQQKLLLQTREHAISLLTKNPLDYGLIHADLVRENILVSQSGLQLIDFDDSGFGFRLFDIATTLFKNRHEPDYPQLKDALLTGYRELKSIDTSSLRLFILIRSLTYLGWIIPRLNEPGAETRQQRFIANAIEQAESFTKSSQPFADHSL